MSVENRFEFDEVKATEEVKKYLQQLRTEPSSFEEYLQSRLDSFQGEFYISGQKKVKTREGPDAVKEALEFIKKQEKLPPFEFDNEALDKAA